MSKHIEEFWTEKIKKKLEDVPYFKENGYRIVCENDLIHTISLNNTLIENKDKKYILDDNIKFNELVHKTENFNTDLIFLEKVDEIHYTPRLVIESKYKTINTHDPITYNYKAEMHKKLYPGLRYGLMIGEYNKEYIERANKKGRPPEDSNIPKIFIKYCENFDFVYTFKETEDKDIDINSKEWKCFISLIIRNLKKSKELENYLCKTNKKTETKNFWIEKNIDIHSDYDDGSIEKEII